MAVRKINEGYSEFDSRYFNNLWDIVVKVSESLATLDGKLKSGIKANVDFRGFIEACSDNGLNYLAFEKRLDRFEDDISSLLKAVRDTVTNDK